MSNTRGVQRIAQMAAGRVDPVSGGAWVLGGTPTLKYPLLLYRISNSVPCYGFPLIILVSRSSALAAGCESGCTSSPSLSTLAATASGFRYSAFNRELDTKSTLVNAPRKWLVLL